MRNIFACLFTLAALVAAASHALVVWDYEPLPAVAHIVLASIAVMSALTAFYLFRSRASWEASMVCPSCHQPAGLSPCTLGRPRPSVIAFILGGIIFAILIQQSQARRFRCAACSAESSRRTVGSWLAVAWCLVLILLLVMEISEE